MGEGKRVRVSWAAFTLCAAEARALCSVVFVVTQAPEGCVEVKAAAFTPKSLRKRKIARFGKR